MYGDRNTQGLIAGRSRPLRKPRSPRAERTQHSLLQRCSMDGTSTARPTRAQEVNTRRRPRPENPYGNAFVAEVHRDVEGVVPR